MQRKIAAIMAADVVGYSRLIAADEEDTLQRLLAYRAIFSDFVERSGGRIFNTAGDAVLAEFPSAVEALRAAIDIQESIRTQNLEVAESRLMRFRIGITIGDVVERDGDLLGDGVNIASRLESIAEPGGICVSRNMHEQVLTKLAVTFRDLGLQNVKNIPSPIQAYAINARPESPMRRGWRLPASLDDLGSRARLVVAALGAALLVGAVAVLVRSGLVARPLALIDPRPKIFGFATDQGLAAGPAGPVTSLDHIPFVCDKCQMEIQAAMLGPSNKAVALSDTGAYGYAINAASPDEARLAALADCSQHRRGDGYCDLYALNGVVVWGKPIELPPPPWIEVDDPAQRLPFNPGLLGGAWASQEAALDRKYGSAFAFKALALGHEGHWFYNSGRSSENEAVRSTLELCGNRTGAPCRLIAINDAFTVAPSKGPVIMTRNASR